MAVIAPEEINLLELPSLPLSRRGELPEIRAVYFSVSNEGNILYIGQTINLKIRWQNHHRFKDFVASNSTKVVWLEVDEKGDLNELEALLIRSFKPLLNKKRGGSRKPLVKRSRADGQIAFRISESLKQDFIKQAKSEGKKPSQVLVELMAEYISRKKEDCLDLKKLKAVLDRHEQDISLLKKQQNELL